MPNILHQFQIQSEPGKVFHAFTSPSGLNSWWTLESDGKPELNETYRFVFGPEYDWRAVVSHVVPGHELTWRVKQAMDDWMPTSFGFRLRTSGSGTTVNFFPLGLGGCQRPFCNYEFLLGPIASGA